MDSMENLAWVGGTVSWWPRAGSLACHGYLSSNVAPLLMLCLAPNCE